MVLQTFYDLLGEQIDTLERTGTLSLSFPNYIVATQSDIQTLAFRLRRRGRLDQVSKMHLLPCLIKNDDKEASLSILETLLSTCLNLTEFVYDEQSAHSNPGVWDTTDIGKLLNACPRLTKLTIDTHFRLLEDPATLLCNLQHPALLQELNIEFVGYDHDHQLGAALAKCSNLQSLSVGTKAASSSGTNKKYISDLLDSIYSNTQKLHSFSLGYFDIEPLSNEAVLLLAKLIRTERLRQFRIWCSLDEGGRGGFAENTAELTEFTLALRENDSLESLHLLGKLGLSEQAVMALFASMETKRSLSSLNFYAEDLALSRKGWDSLLQSLGKSNSLTNVRILTDFVEHWSLVSQIVEELRTNTSITHFAVRTADYSDCSCSPGPLLVLSERNKRIKAARELVVPSDNNYFPESLVPLAMSALQTPYTGDGTAIFTALRNVSSMFTTVGKRHRQPPAKSTRPKRKCAMKKA